MASGTKMLTSKLQKKQKKTEQRKNFNLNVKALLSSVIFAGKLLKSIKPGGQTAETKSGSQSYTIGIKSSGENCPYQSPVTYFDKIDIYHPLFNVKYIDKYGAYLKSNYFLKNNDVIALFFTSSRCKRCNTLLPTLKEIHQKAKQQNIRFEIVNIGLDCHKEELMTWFRMHHGNWFGIAYEDQMREALRYMYGVLAIPKIIVLNSSGHTITRAGLEEIETFGVDVLIKWI